MSDSTVEELFGLEEVSVEVDGRTILDRLDGAIPTGCLTVVGGPSGAGKTSLLRLLNRLDAPTRGKVRLRGEDLATADAVSLRRDVAMVFQQPPLFPGVVAENLRVADRGLDDSDIESALVGVGLAPTVAGQEADTLSVGEAQRLCFARALVSEPTVLLADEPTSALDPIPKRAIEELARGLVDSGLSVVWVSHEADQVRRIADHVMVLDRGRLVTQGSPDALAADPSPVVRSVVGGAR